MTESPPDPDAEIRLVPMTGYQRRALVCLKVELDSSVWDDACAPLVEKYDRSPTDYWDQIAEEYQRHRCKDPDCFTESVLMRLGVISFGNPLSPYGF